MSIKKKIVTYALGTVAVALAGFGYLGGKHVLAEPAGEKCETETKCRGDSIISTGMCMAVDEVKYCTHECASASDCPSGLACEPVDGTWTTSTTRGNHATQTRTSTGTKMLCVKPTARSSQ